VTSCRERPAANLVFTEPSLGALAMMTNVRFVGVIESFITVASGFDKYCRVGFHADRGMLFFPRRK